MTQPTEFMITESLRMQAYAKLMLLAQSQEEWNTCVSHLRNAVDCIEQLKREWAETSEASEGSLALAVAGDAVDPVLTDSVEPSTRD